MSGRRCPCCQTFLDRLVGPRSLQRGDITICAYCGEALRFNGRELYRMSGREFDEAMQRPDFQKAMAAVAEVRQRRNN